MSTRIRHSVPAFLNVATVLLAASPSLAASWQAGVNYGASTTMDLYVPTSPKTSPPIVVALHYCGGNSGSAHSWFQSYADQYGFIIIAPSAGGNCFDATPARSGERANIVKMVQYVTTQNSADTKRVFAAGASSGACMTQALLAAYPDVFAAGSSLAGVPAGAWTGGNAYGWSTPAGTTDAQWGDKVRQADSGFTGTRPRVQLWQGQGDTTLTYSQNFPAEVGQWTNVFGVTSADGTKTSVKPPGAQDTWDRTSYKDQSGLVVVEANSGGTGVPHDLTGRGLWADVVRFFGLDGSTPVSDGGTGTDGATGVGGSQGTGGSKADGGTSGTGGKSGGSGGSSAGSGGSSAGSGGSSSGRGGSNGSGGSSSSGAAGSATAGSSNGASGAAGSTVSGNGSGGSNGEAGSSSSGTPGDSSSGGCGCTVGVRRGPFSAFAGLTLALFAGLVRRKTRRRND